MPRWIRGLQQKALWRIGLVLTIGSAAGSALALGGAHPYVLLAIAPFCLVGCACLFISHPSFELTSARWPTPTWVFLGLAGYTLLQSIPLPVVALEFLSPAAADVWSRALSPFEEPVFWGSLSLDPGASLREALKWLLYALNFAAAALVAKRYGRHFPALVVFGTGLSVAVATILHAVAQASKIYGVYEPAISGSRFAVGPFLNPNTLAGYMNLAALAGLGLLSSRRLTEHRWLIALGLAIVVSVSVLSGSRGGLIALPIGLLLFAVLVRLRGTRRRPTGTSGWARWVPVLAVTGAGALLATLAIREYFWNQFSQEDFEKLAMVAWCVPMIRDFWSFGVGRGAFGSAFAAYAPPADNKTYLYPENLVIQWLSEWGLLPTLVALAGLVWAFRPRYRSIRGDSLGAGAAAGVAIVLLQNLVDFGLERLASPLAVTWALAVLWKRHEPAETMETTSRRFSVMPSLVPAAGGCLWVLVMVFGSHDLTIAKRTLYEASRGVDRFDKAGIAAVRGQLRAAMLRFPAEPYFPRLGAEIGLLVHQPQVLRWVSRALELGMNDPRTHLVAARALARYGVMNQAMMELRMAAELDSSMAATTGRLAALWARDLDGLERAAPAGATGAQMLTVAASALKQPAQRQLREAALRAAVNRDGSYLPARRVLVEHLIGDVKAGRCKPRSNCERAALRHADALMRQQEQRALGVQLKAELLQALGHNREADELLAQTCPRLGGDERRRCLRARLALLRKHEEPPRSTLVELVNDLSEQPCGARRTCARMFSELGHALLEAGDPAGALEHLDRATSQEPSLKLLLKIADVAAELGQFHRAENALDRAESLATARQSDLVRSKRAMLQRRIVEQLRR